MEKVKLYIIDLKGDELDSLSLKVKQKEASSFLKYSFIGKYTLGEYGKPLSDQCFFNISHSASYVILAIGAKPIGVDVELIKEFKNELKAFISSKEEIDYIKDELSFFQVWTSKESLLKCEGSGLANVIKEVPALPLDGEKVFKNNKYYSKSIVQDKYVISVTLLGDEPFEIEVEYLD